MTNKAYDISVLAEELGFALSSPDMEQRVAGTNLLSAVLVALPEDLLEERQLEFLSTFYMDRLRDHHNVMPAIIDGIDALVHMKALPPSHVPLILQAFFTLTTCQSQTRGDRTKLFNLFKYLTLNFRKGEPYHLNYYPRKGHKLQTLNNYSYRAGVYGRGLCLRPDQLH